MTLLANNFDGGTDGAGTTGGVTTGNSANSGTAFNTISIPTATSATFNYDATGALSGLGGRWQVTGGSTGWRAYHSWSTVTQAAARVVFTFNTSVINSFSIAGSVNNTSFATVLKFATDSGGKLLAQNAAGSTLATTASALSAGTAYVIEYQIQPGSTTSTGVVSVQVYTAAAPGTLLINFSSSTANLGTVTGIVRGQIGNNDTVASFDITYDALAYSTGTLTAIGPPSVSPSAALAASTAVPPSDTEDAVSIGMTIRGV